MKERIKELRKALGLTMEKFGAELGLKKNTISQLESGVNNVSEQVMKSICKTNWNGRYVNEVWLRTGEGDMFTPLTEDEVIARLIARFPSEPPGSPIKRIFAVMSVLPEDQCTLLADIAEVLAKRKADE